MKFNPTRLLLSCLLCMGAVASHAEEFRVGFINTDRIFREANTAKVAQSKLEQEFSKREKELVEQISYQNKGIQIKGQAEIERSRIPSQSPYFMLGKGQFEIDDAKRKIESGATQKGFELEARQAIADAEIAKIQRLVFEDNVSLISPICIGK